MTFKGVRESLSDTVSNMGLKIWMLNSLTRHQVVSICDFLSVDLRPGIARMEIKTPSMLLFFLFKKGFQQIRGSKIFFSYWNM